MSDGGADDGGLQPERTRLAWRRATLAATAIPLLGVSRLVAGGVHHRAALGLALVVLSWIGVLIVADRRIRELRRRRSGGPAAARRWPAALAGLTALLGVASLLVLL